MFALYFMQSIEIYSILQLYLTLTYTVHLTVYFK
jgi:hypothetical protein